MGTPAWLPWLLFFLGIIVVVVGGLSRSGSKKGTRPALFFGLLCFIIAALLWFLPALNP